MIFVLALVLFMCTWAPGLPLAVLLAWKRWEWAPLIVWFVVMQSMATAVSLTTPR